MNPQLALQPVPGISELTAYDQAVSTLLNRLDEIRRCLERGEILPPGECRNSIGRDVVTWLMSAPKEIAALKPQLDAACVAIQAIRGEYELGWRRGLSALEVARNLFEHIHASTRDGYPITQIHQHLSQGVCEHLLESVIPPASLRELRRAVMAELLELKNHRRRVIEGAAAASQIATQEAQPLLEPPVTTRSELANSSKVPLAQANIRVRGRLCDWHRNNVGADPWKVNRDDIARDTGVSTGGVSNTEAWKAFAEKRKPRTRSAPRTVPLTEQMTAILPDRGEGLEELMAESERDMAEEDSRPLRGSRPRHGRS